MASAILRLQNNLCYLYGLPESDTEMPQDDAYGYSGKEFTTTKGLNFYDFGARTYVPDEGRFWQPDPKAGDYHWLSPYAYCAGDPINKIDPTGCNPIYNTQGFLIGVTDTGLQGMPYIISENNDFRHMTTEEIKRLNLGVKGLVDEEAVARYLESVVSLPNRPDWDGYITLEEANNWYRNGNGQPLFADLRKIDLSGVVSLGEDYVGQEKYVNLLWYSGSINDGLVYGTIKLKRYPNHGVRAYDDTYDFDIKDSNSPGTIIRNILTKIGTEYAGSGTAYPIQFYGTAKLKPKWPWTK